MSETGKTGKRIVSKREYLANVGKKGAWSSVGVGMILVSLACILVAVMIFPLLLVVHSVNLTELLIGRAVHVFGMGRRTLKVAKSLETGVLLTRANTADLPAPDSLIRASVEPTQAQETILLRAATATQTNETPAEQLVRPVSGLEGRRA